MVLFDIRREQSHGINPLLAFQLLCYVVCSLQVLEVALDEVDFDCISVLLQSLHCLFGMLFLLGNEDDFRGIVLQQMGGYAKSNPCCSACDNVNLWQEEHVNTG